MISDESAGTVTIGFERVFRSWDYPLYAVLTLVRLAAAIYVLALWGSLFDRFERFDVFLAGVILLAGHLIFALARWSALPRMQRAIPRSPTDDWRVAVITTFVPKAESREMLERSVESLVEMDYLCDVWILDEGNDEETKQVCERTGARHFSRNGQSRYQADEGPFCSTQKYGNLNAWLHEVGFERYDIVVSIDPDQVPKRTYLGTLVGCFEDPRVAYAESSLHFYNETSTFVARGFSEIRSAFCSIEQLVKNSLGCPSIFGSQFACRMAALKEVGGWPPYNPEDEALRRALCEKGWKGVYIPKIEASGLAPSDWNAYLGMQLRDIKWSFYRKAKVLPRQSGASKVWPAFLGWVPLLILAGVIGLAVRVVQSLLGGELSLANLGGAAPRVLVGLIVFHLCGSLYRRRFYLQGYSRGLRWRSMLLVYATLPLVFVAAWNVARRDRFPFVVTPKLVDRRLPRLLFWPQLSIAVTSALVLAVGWQQQRFELQLVAAIPLVLSLALLLSLWREPPPPFSPERLDAWQGRNANRSRTAAMSLSAWIRKSPRRREFLRRWSGRLARLKARYDLWRIRRGPTRALGPQFPRSQDCIEIDITYVCNLACFNCDRSIEQAPSRDRMSVEQIRRFLDQSIAAGTRWRRIRLLGGEPTVHPQFLEIIEMLMGYRAEFSPGTLIEVTSNGYGRRVNEILSRLPPEVVVRNTSKSGPVQEGFDTFNVAPVDRPEYADADYRNGCWITWNCGIGLTPYGYYPCAVAGGIDRIFGLGLGRSELPQPGDGMFEQLEAFCSRCGHFKREFQPETLTETRKSETWEHAYRSAREKLVNLPPF